MASLAQKAGGTAGSSAAWTATIAALIGTATVAVSASDRALSAPQIIEKAAGIRRLLPYQGLRKGWENPPRFAGHWGVALLNDALLRRLSGAGSGRIAQLVEQLTLNQRVPGSSPGAPTKQEQSLATLANQNGPFSWKASLIRSEVRSRTEFKLLRALSLFLHPSRYEIQRADRLVQVEYMLVVD